MIDAKKRGSNAFREMREKLVSLPDELSPQDAGALLALLKETPPESEWVRVTWAAFVNDALNRLRSLDKIPEGLVGGMDSLNADQTAPEVLRDYALQHLGGLAVEKKLSPSDRIIISACLERNRRDRLSSRCGTALNVTENLLAQHSATESPSIPGPCTREQLVDDCLSVLKSENSSEHGQISALGVLGRLKSGSGVEIARSLLSSSASPVLVKAAALSYLAPYANDADREMCRGLSASSDRRLSVPARRLLKQSSLQTQH